MHISNPDRVRVELTRSEGEAALREMNNSIWISKG